jgi:multidrug efflux pump subunit AcrA (membrane-fusion protein)
VVRGAAAPPVRASGLVAGKEEARLGFKMGGVVAEVLVDEGARVEKGQRLATLKQDEASSRSVQARRGVRPRAISSARTLHTQGVGTLRLQDAQTAPDGARPDDGGVRPAARGDRRARRRHRAARMAEPNEMVQPAIDRA